MFHRYIDQYKRGIALRIHGNESIKHLKLLIVQYIDTIAAIINECVDQMPHQMRIIQPSQMNTFKLIPGTKI